MGDSWYSGFFDSDKDTFSQLAGAYLGYEQIQNQKDASGQAQSAVNETPENSQNVQQPIAPVVPVVDSNLITGVPNAYLVFGGIAAIALIIAVK